MKKQPIIYVIVVTYKGKQWYDKCFSSLQESTIPVHIVVVDNTPGADDANYIREHFPEIHIIKTAENLGFGRANNLGMRYALDHDCDYVFLLNQDAWVEPNMMELLLEQSMLYPEYGILSPIHTTSDMQHIETGLLHYLADYRQTDRHLLEDLLFDRVKGIYESKYINAAGWLLPRNTLETVGGFDPIYYHYEEDDDYLNRTRFHKLKIGIVPAARMVHDHRNNNLSITGEKTDYRRHQFLLVQFTDLNCNRSISAYRRYYIRKWVMALLSGKCNELHRWYSDYHFLGKMRKRIKKSREINSYKGRTWL